MSTALRDMSEAGLLAGLRPDTRDAAMVPVRDDGDNRGVAAVEFALVAFPFFLLLFGILEVAMLFFTSVVLDGAAGDAARMVRTGQVQDDGSPITSFKDKLCTSLYSMVPCDELLFDVTTFNSFSEADIPPMYDEDGNPLPVGFDPGAPGDIVVVRVSYMWDFLVPFLATSFGGDVELTSTVVFRNEPYEGPI